MAKNSKVVLVDADACPVPVKEDIIDLTKKYQWEVIFVASFAHFSSNASHGQWVLVDSEKEEVDLYIVNHVVSGNVVVTQDYGLASLLLPRGVYVMSPRGMVYKEEKIGDILHARYLSAKNRRAGKRVKGPKKFTEADRQSFRTSFEEKMSIYEGKS
ncbi:YaiI/YqxD family protein [Pseudalkalibacillus caeni]|uniref:UPF0178 protein FCL54_03450 n=1 Tax=Exobacillus caeni TaxID=2574798 RepID=A0A5R9FCH7_9BACL|nr:DUF188 domain-containing protein [Pseudalkalibacillus caeni]TLS39368.1 DUF188 domain-containing protein [Pseudalkalibacillus caeni]